MVDCASPDEHSHEHLHLLSADCQIEDASAGLTWTQAGAFPCSDWLSAKGRVGELAFETLPHLLYSFGPLLANRFLLGAFEAVNIPLFS